jgi:hypothetical protein
MRALGDGINKKEQVNFTMKTRFSFQLSDEKFHNLHANIKFIFYILSKGMVSLAIHIMTYPFL